MLFYFAVSLRWLSGHILLMAAEKHLVLRRFPEKCIKTPLFMIQVYSLYIYDRIGNSRNQFVDKKTL